MSLVPTIDAVKLIQPLRHVDFRGYFVVTWSRAALADIGISVDFVQDNAAFSKGAWTVRGLHYQRAPRAQAKLVRVVRGSVFDVAVDLRRELSTFGGHVASRLTAAGGEQMFIPAGFAHGYCTLEPDTEVAYKVSEFYSSDHDAGILWNDPALAIDWPLGGNTPILSERDKRHPQFSEAAGF